MKLYPQPPKNLASAFVLVTDLINKELFELEKERTRIRKCIDELRKIQQKSSELWEVVDLISDKIEALTTYKKTNNL